MINGHQCRAGRALLRWRREDLAEKTGISVVSIKHFEDEHHQTRVHTITKIRNAMEAAGVDFLADSGVRLRNDTLVVIDAPGAFLRLMDDIYHTLKDKGGEVLWTFIDDGLSPPEVLAADARIRDAGIAMRAIVSEKVTVFPYPLNEYRCVPDHMIVDNHIVIYGDKVAICLGQPCHTVFIVRNPGFALTQKHLFEIVWATHPMPTQAKKKLSVV